VKERNNRVAYLIIFEPCV